MQNDQTALGLRRAVTLLQNVKWLVGYTQEKKKSPPPPPHTQPQWWRAAPTSPPAGEQPAWSLSYSTPGSNRTGLCLGFRKKNKNKRTMRKRGAFNMLLPRRSSFIGDRPGTVWLYRGSILQPGYSLTVICWSQILARDHRRPFCLCCLCESDDKQLVTVSLSIRLPLFFSAKIMFSPVLF